jgi:hypothetical protein
MDKQQLNVAIEMLENPENGDFVAGLKKFTAWTKDLPDNSATDIE